MILKYRENSKLCDMDADSFKVQIKLQDIYVDIAKDFETRSDTLNYTQDRLLTRGKKVIVLILMKKELGGKIMIAA